MGASTGQLLSIVLQEIAEREKAKQLEAEEKAESVAPVPSEEPPPQPQEGGAGAVGASEELTGECSGASACASSSTSCKIELRFGEPAGNELWDVGEFKCNRVVPHFQLEVYLLVEILLPANLQM